MATAMAMLAGASAYQRCFVLTSAYLVFISGRVCWHQRWSAVIYFLTALVYFGAGADGDHDI
jgi:hypothetical protein